MSPALTWDLLTPHPACHSTLREQRGNGWKEGESPVPLRRCGLGSPSPRGASPSMTDWPGWESQPGFCSHSSISCSLAFSWSACGKHKGTVRQSRGAVPSSAVHRLYLVLHQPIAGRTLLAAGAQWVKEEVGLALVTLVAHKARVAEAGAVLVALRGDGAQRGAVAGCSGGRKVSHCGCQPCFRDKDAVPIPVTSAAPGREAKEAVLASITSLPCDTWLAGALPRQRVAPALPRACWVALTAGTRSGAVRNQGWEHGAMMTPGSPVLCPTYLLQPTVGSRP